MLLHVHLDIERFNRLGGLRLHLSSACQPDRKQTPQITLPDVARMSGGVVTRSSRGVGLSINSRSISSGDARRRNKTNGLLRTKREQVPNEQARE